jgi:phage-related tail fiber protein
VGKREEVYHAFSPINLRRWRMKIYQRPVLPLANAPIVQIDAVGGLAVAAGVLSLASTAVTPGTYPKVTVDAKGRVTAGASLAASDLPTHTHVAGDVASGAFGVNRGGTGLTTVAANKLAEITKLKDGRTALAYKAENAVDMETGAIVAVTTHGGASADTEGHHGKK